jgi:uncharacterized membrane protein YhfC
MGIFASILSVCTTLVLPVAAALWLILKRKKYLVPVLLGVLTFSVFQVLTRIPALSLMGQTAWYTMFTMKHPMLNALFLGATAGLFEEGGRWIVMRLFMSKRRRVSDGIAFGIGHGGLEAVLLVGINAAAILIIYGGSTAPGMTFAGGVERIFTLVLHVGWSVMVLKSVTQKKPLWLLLAFATHTAVDYAAVMFGVTGASILVSEIVLAAFSLAMLVYIIFEYRKRKGGEFTCKKLESC